MRTRADVPDQPRAAKMDEGRKRMGNVEQFVSHFISGRRNRRWFTPVDDTVNGNADYFDPWWGLLNLRQPPGNSYIPVGINKILAERRRYIDGVTVWSVKDHDKFFDPQVQWRLCATGQFSLRSYRVYVIESSHSRESYNLVVKLFLYKPLVCQMNLTPWNKE